MARVDAHVPAPHSALVDEARLLACGRGCSRVGDAVVLCMPEDLEGVHSGGQLAAECVDLAMEIAAKHFECLYHDSR